MEGLQPALAHAGLQQRCHMCVEFARAMREAAKGVLRGVRLPALQAAEPSGGPLWLAQVRARSLHAWLRAMAGEMRAMWEAAKAVC